MTTDQVIGSAHYLQLLAQHGLLVSMSRTGNCYDNAVVESFFAIMKVEQVHHCHYITRDQAQSDIFLYIEGFYNRQRRYSTLGYLSPEAFERNYYNSLFTPSI